MSRPTAERPGHRCTTRHAQAVYPFVASGGLGARGVFIGRDSSGGVLESNPPSVVRCNSHFSQGSHRSASSALFS